MQVLQQQVYAQEEYNSPLIPSPVFDVLVDYKVHGRNTPNPIATIEVIKNHRPKRLSYTVLDMRYEVAKREFIGDSTVAAEVILQDLLRSRTN
jgi:hypothetical protein